MSALPIVIAKVALSIPFAMDMDIEKTHAGQMTRKGMACSGRGANALPDHDDTGRHEVGRGGRESCRAGTYEQGMEGQTHHVRSLARGRSGFSLQSHKGVSGGVGSAGPPPSEEPLEPPKGNLLVG